MKHFLDYLLKMMSSMPDPQMIELVLFATIIIYIQSIQLPLKKERKNLKIVFIQYVIIVTIILRQQMNIKN
jgi:hypothetical protein